MNSKKNSEETLKQVFEGRRKLGKYKFISNHIKKSLNKFYLDVIIFTYYFF